MLLRSSTSLTIGVCMLISRIGEGVGTFAARRFT
jgi:hypothetical protein